MENTPADLIYDVGLHRGEDAEFYLKKGFRVVGIEADPELCRAASTRLAGALANGQLTIVNQAIASAAGSIVFHRSTKRSEWGTIDPAWADRNRRKGAGSTQIMVDAAPLGDLFERFGAPYFVKIDIEGMDLTALRSLSGLIRRPRFVSIESEKVSFDKLRVEFDTFRELGYDSFKVVAQHTVHRQVPPIPAREGCDVAHRFERNASGLFGEEAPGQWLTADAAIEVYKPIFRRYRLVGDDPSIGTRILRPLARTVGFRAGWYDTHARLAPGSRYFASR